MELFTTEHELQAVRISQGVQLHEAAGGGICVPSRHSGKMSVHITCVCKLQGDLQRRERQRRIKLTPLSFCIKINLRFLDFFVCVCFALERQSLAIRDD